MQGRVGLNILVCFIVVAVVESIPGPQKEVVSIYNDDFTTPASRPQYFIEVYRCVNVGEGDCDVDTPKTYPVPSAMTKIEIVVADITNRRDSSSNKFYRYVVYNHSLCRCGTLGFRENALYQNLTNSEVSEAYFNANYEQNPENMIHRCHSGDCKPQTRYRLARERDHQMVIPKFKYLAYQQCLSGSVALKNRTFNRLITTTYGKEEYVTLTNDTSCKAYDGRNVERQQCSNSSKHGNPQTFSADGNWGDKESNYGILVYIPSGKVILAAFLLSLILFTIFIMDITLCRRRKGFIYALVCCKNDNADHFCQDCKERMKNEI